MMHTLGKYLLVSIAFVGLIISCADSGSHSKSEATAIAEWIKIDDFESANALQHWISVDTKNDTDPRVERPQVTAVLSEADREHHYLMKKPAAEGIIGNRKALSYRKLPATVAVGETYTFYMRFNVEYFPNNHVFGLSNLTPEGINAQDYNALEPSLRITDKYESDGTKNDGTLMVRKGKGYAKIMNSQTNKTAMPLEADTWYEVWYVVNNDKVAQGGQHYDVYIRGGEEFPEQQQVYTKADFRMQRELPLLYFMANCNTGPVDNPYGNGGLRYDDLYMAKGIMLTVPSS